MLPSSTPVAFRSAVDLSAAISRSELSCRELAECLLERIERLDPQLHAFVTVYADETLAAATAADQAIATGHRIGSFHGIPIGIKDIIDMEGRVTTGGSKMWQERISPSTATLVRHLIAGGLLMLGKTHTVEFAMGSFGTNQQQGTPWNPWSQSEHHIPGGSSAGSGVAVAAGLAPWAIGTDTGGSVRLPASFCGIVGLKTTIGRVSCDGVLPLSTTLDTPGPICRTVEDAAWLYDLLRGIRCDSDRRDKCESWLRAGVDRLKLAQLPQSERAIADAEVLEAYDRSLSVLADLGATIVDIELPQCWEELGTVVGGIIGVEGYSFVGEFVDDPDLPLDDDVRPRIQLGRSVTAQQYLAWLRQQQQAKKLFHEALRGIDALLTPTTATAAPRVDEVDQTGTAAYFTRPVNLLEACALALPNGFTSGGLPTSLQVVCGSRRERMALRIGWAFEQATTWHQQIPDGFA